MIQYILECIAFQLVFLIIYDFFLKRETFFQWNRLYLIGTYILSIVLPWVKIEALKTTVPEQYYVYPEFLWNANTVPATVNSSEISSFTLSLEEGILYAGMLVAATYFGYKLYQIYKLRNAGAIQRFPNFTKIIVKNSELAFSFFKSIFLGDKVVQREHQSIIQHELVHIGQGHSWDLLFFELMRIVGWFNPLVYVYQSRVSELHEFIADSKVVKTDKKKQYEFLLSQIFQTENISFVNQFFKTSLIKKRIAMLQRKQSKKVWQLKYLLLVPLVLGMLLYTSSEAQESESTKQEQTSDDAALIAKLNAKIDSEIEKLGSINKVHREFNKRYALFGDDYLMSKDDYFESVLLDERHFEQYADSLEKAETPFFRKNSFPKRPLPSTARYESYVERTKAFLILDDNLRVSISANRKNEGFGVRPIELKNRNAEGDLIFEVKSVKDLTGEEVRAFNNKMYEVFKRNDSGYLGFILTDGEYAFEIFETKPFNDLKETQNEQIDPEIIIVNDIENLTSEEENTLFERLQALSNGAEGWQLFVKDDDAQLKFVPSENGSYISGPNGERIFAKLALDSKLSSKEASEFAAILEKMKQSKLDLLNYSNQNDLKLSKEKSSTIDRYNQLVAERKRLLMSSDEKNPVIVNLDQQIQGLKQSIDGESHVKLNSKDDLTAKYNQLLAERRRLLKSSNEKNPVIVNLDQQLEGLRKAAFGDGETVPFAVVEEVPVFPGCEEEGDKRACFQEKMQRHISENFSYPQEAQEKGIQGRVAIMFTISETGAINNIKVRGPHQLLEEEAERIISRLPEMKPGKHKGELVNVPFSIPITFKLQGEKSLFPLKLDVGVEPLIMIDGKESSKEVMNYIAPNDIESINVWKDEAAINLYGEKGKYGVVDIRTKKNGNSAKESNEIYKADTNTMSVTATAKDKNGSKIISGTVTDGMMGLPGATIGIEGSERGVISDFDGNFEIKAKKGDVIVFQYIGLPILKFTVTEEEKYQITKKK